MNDANEKSLDERLRMKILHQIMTILGVPIMIALAGLYGNSILGKIDDIAVEQRNLVAQVGAVNVTLASNLQILVDYGRRLDRLEANAVGVVRQ